MERRASTAGAERRVAVWGAIAFGAVLASYTAFRPVRDALVVDGDPDGIAWLFTATFVASAVASPAWGAILARGSRRTLIPWVFHVFAACALAFGICVALEVSPTVVGRTFYVWASVFSLFVISVFWSLLADLLGPDAARRLYGPIAAGGTVGGLVGPALTRLLVEPAGVAGILVLSAALLEVALVAAMQMWRAGEALAPTARAGDQDDLRSTNGALEGLARIRRSPYLLAIVGYVLCTAVAATLVYMEQTQIARAELPDREARTAFFASIDFWVAAATFVVQVFLAGRLLAWVGPGIVLAILPVVQAAGISVLALAPSLATLVAVQVAARTATHGLTRPARELLFTVVDRSDKYRAKNVIDTLVYRFGDFGGAWLQRGLVALGAGGIAFTIAAGPLLAAWLALAALLGAGFRRRRP
ncbi:MAG: MFS transporter [Deltaproteobacteria bacterium]|nr:MFS transporter [Deltaproteobacteria bacterium]